MTSADVIMKVLCKRLNSITPLLGNRIINLQLCTGSVLYIFIDLYDCYTMCRLTCKNNNFTNNFSGRPFVIV